MFLWITQSIPREVAETNQLSFLNSYVQLKTTD